MSTYLLIQSKSPWESGDIGQFYALARELGEAGNQVTLFLLQNGVMAARSGASDAGLDSVTAKVRVLADDFSLRERAIGAQALKPAVRPASIDTVVDLLAEGAKALWH